MSTVQIGIAGLLLAISACNASKQNDASAISSTTASTEVSDDFVLSSIGDPPYDPNDEYIIEATADIQDIRRAMFVDGQRVGFLDELQGKIGRCESQMIHVHGQGKMRLGRKATITFVHMADGKLLFGFEPENLDFHNLICASNNGTSTEAMTYGHFKAITGGRFRILAHGSWSEVLRSDNGLPDQWAEMSGSSLLADIGDGSFEYFFVNDSDYVVPHYATFADGFLGGYSDQASQHIGRCRMIDAGFGESLLHKNDKDLIEFGKVSGTSLRLGFAGYYAHFDGINVSGIECDSKSGPTSGMTYDQFKNITGSRFKILTIQ